jgi:hypothetical protein
MDTREVRVANILTRASGYLASVCSHSLAPYRGCSFGKSACGVGCYMRHIGWVTRGREWGEFLEVRVNAVEAYRRGYARERRWARDQSRPIGSSSRRTATACSTLARRS